METSAHIASKIMEGWEARIGRFKEITGGVKMRFETRDWKGIQQDCTERIDLYKMQVRETAALLKSILGEDAENTLTWRKIKKEFSALNSQRPDYEISETFFNSVIRKVLINPHNDNRIMFIFSDHDHRHLKSAQPIYKTYWPRVSTEQLVRDILLDYRFAVPYQELEKDIAYITQAINQKILSKFKPGLRTRVEVLRAVFYRNKEAYIVGRVHIDGNLLPFILPVLNRENGIIVDSLILDYNDVSMIFSFTRSYFLVAMDIPSELVAFLKTLMPLKRTEELYTSIGFNKHGKTEFYRNFLRHLQGADDKFIIAPGIKGMVMSVFMLESYNIVFKLIKDKFDPPKQVTHEQVKAKYKLVSRHDRIGRMADTHEFENFIFEKNRFSEDLLSELLAVAPSIVSLTGETVLIRHLYTERKMTPLNIYLEKATPQAAEDVVAEYGNAIKQLAAANIFPGDMLLKNFGVTRHGRVVFYDYDEICFLTDCNFRRMPEARDDYDEYASEPWFSVGENDIFPEEFKKFLIGYDNIREMFFRLHGDLFDVKFWKEMQEKQRRGEILDVFPYRRSKRFDNTR